MLKSYMTNTIDLIPVPCSSGGVAIEILISLVELKIKRKAKWVMSSYSFSNLNYGRTYNNIIVDCFFKKKLWIK